MMELEGEVRALRAWVHGGRTQQGQDGGKTRKAQEL